MEFLKEALQYIRDLGVSAEHTEVMEICGRTYVNRDLVRMDKAPKARPVGTVTLSSMVDYITSCNLEFSSDMIVHIVNPTTVCLMSVLDKEREREVLFESNAETSEFRFDQWYDQETFMIALQANFQPNDDLATVMRLAGNIEKKNNQTFSDDGRTQVATMTVGVASKADVIVPNPVELIPYRTFQEVAQPTSKFVFRIGDKEVPAFRLIEAEGGIWRSEAVENIKCYFQEKLENVPDELRKRITIIG
ncbi:MAG: hypothetical protein RR446_07410 [Lachnospiraceae bacterium]